jgi:hypothetical protein
MEKSRKILTGLLIAFVLVSIGFALGKHSVKNSNFQADKPADQSKYVVVYYMHSTFRCVTCNTIEKMTRDLLEQSYAQELAAGQIKWQEVDFQENEELAEKFAVVSSCVVVAQMDKSRIVGFKRLDEVWTLMQKPAAFNQYISAAINSYLTGQGVRL